MKHPRDISSPGDEITRDPIHRPRARWGFFHEKETIRARDTNRVILNDAEAISGFKQPGGN